MSRPAAKEAHEDAPPSMANSALLRELPATERGLRTRSALIAAARTVFERAGYLDTRLIDITKEAKCSAGSFYTYFSSKEEIFAAVLELAQEDMMHPGMPHVAADDDPAAIIEASNRAYFEAYRRNAKLMALLEQVASIDPEFRKLRQRRADAFVFRNARSIEALQKRGMADAELDPLLASRALSGMISRLAFGYFVTGDSMSEGRKVDLGELTATATRLWVNALRISIDDRAS
ncbi:TetR/AcrR family transcriptional regulator [Rhodococcus sp. NPDC003322]